MKRRNAPKITVLLLLGLMLVLSLTSSVTGQQLPGRGSFVPAGREAPTFVGFDSIQSQAVRMADGRIQVIVTLEGNPAVVNFANAGGRANRAAANAAASVRRGEILVQQATFINTAKATLPNLSVVNRSQYLVNTVTVAISPNSVRALASLPGVTRVSANRIVQRDDTTSIPFIGAPSAWEGFGSFGALTGDGEVIAVVDTGIDYTHLHFGGSGNYDDVPDDTTLDNIPGGMFPAVWDEDTGFTADGDPKVVGGWDFVGNDYDANVEGSTPVPDPNPLDCPVADGGGHGSHVAGTAAGWGVAEGDPATTYAGPFDSTIFTGFPNITTSLRIGPGVAPRAALVALRVFGCGGSTDTSNVIAAFDAAAAGQIVDESNNVLAEFPVADVINMSLGSNFGDGGPNDPENVASENVALAGITFVASAGNANDTFFITGSPGVGNSAINVANSTDTSAVLQGAVTRTDGTDAPATYAAALAAFGPEDINLEGGTVLQALDDANSAGPTTTDGCTTLTNAEAVAGKIALVDRGGCTFVIKANNVFAAGAVGLLVANNAAGVPISMGGVPNAGYNIPSVMISQADGVDLKANLPATIDIVANVETIVGAPDIPDKLVASSSRGPVINDGDSFKPNLAAPGDSITSARSGTGDQVYVIGGTSMASPHVAGVMALLREAYPDWTVQQLKALVINTANNNVTNGANVPFPPQRIGSGRVDVEDALSSEVIAYNAADPAGVSVSFGFPEIVAGDTLVDTRDITVENNGEGDVTFDVSYVAYSDMATTNVAFSVSPSTITVAAGLTQTVTVTLTANPYVAGVHTNSDTTLTPLNANRHRLTEESGLVVLAPTAGSTTSLRIPVYVAPRVQSDMAATAPSTFGATVSSDVIPLSGAGVFTGVTANDILSLVSASELIATSPNEENTPNEADLQYFGITSDYQAAGDGDGETFFSIVTHSEWHTLNQVEFDVFLDLDQDGSPDFIVYNSAALNGTSRTDQFTVNVVDVNDAFGFGAGAGVGLGNIPNGYNANVNTYVHLNNVVILPMYTEFLSDFIGDSDPSFDYWVETFSIRTDGVVDSVASQETPLTYNPAEPALSFNDLAGVYDGPYEGAPLWADIDGEAIPVDYNLAGLDPNALPQILVLHHHNDDTLPAEVISLSVDETVLFDLVSPADGTVLTTTAAIAAVDAVTWEESTGAATYNFELAGPSEASSALLEDLTPAADEDLLTCADGTCSLNVDGVIDGLLVENGEYSWYVSAFNDAGEVPANNNPFTFTVAVPAPVNFLLLGPGGPDASAAPVITDPAAVSPITWTASDADAYNFVLIQISGNTIVDFNARIGVILDLDLTAAEDSDGLTCVESTCTLTADTSALADGRYAWTVIADNGFDTTEAGNAPFYLTVNTGDIELLANGGFETAGVDAKSAESWAIKNSTKDTRKVNVDKAASGEAYIQFKGNAGENSKIQQKVELNPAYINLGGLFAGDQLQASVLAKTGLTSNMSLSVKVKYTDTTAGVNGDGKDKVVVDIVGPTTEYQAFSGTLTIDSATSSVKFAVGFKSTSGKLLIDDASLVRLSSLGVNSGFGGKSGLVPLPPSSFGSRSGN